MSKFCVPFLNTSSQTKLIGLIAIIGLLVGCSPREKVSYEYECPEKNLVLLSLIDLSASGRSPDILTERLNAIQVDAERVTDCDATLHLIGWTASSASSVEIFQSKLATVGATEIGRDRKITRAVKSTMAQVRQGLAESLQRSDPSNSDLFGAIEIIAEVARSLSVNETLEATVYSDAITNVSNFSVNKPEFTESEASQLAKRALKVDLSGIKIKIVGVGRTSQDVPQAPAGYVSMLIQYATFMCENTKAVCRISSLYFQ